MNEGRALGICRTLGIVALAAFAVVASVLTLAGTVVEPTSLPTTAQLTVLAERARFAANQSGEKAPHDATAVATTRRAINKLLGTVIPSDAAVFAVTLQGHFSAYAASGQGGFVPTGDVIVLVVREHDLEVVDTYLLGQPPNVGKLGPVFPLELRAA